MSKLRGLCLGVSIDGFGAGPGQSLDNPLGVGGMGLHQWVFPDEDARLLRATAPGPPETDALRETPITCRTQPK